MEKQWLTSKESQKDLKIKGCDLMHHRVKGEIEFTKKGNAFLYAKDSLDKIKKLSS